MEKNQIIQITIPQQGTSPIVIAFSDFSLLQKYISENNISTFIVQSIIYFTSDDEKVCD